MPQGTAVAKAEAGLEASARKKGMKGKRAAHYIYGALNNLGLKRGNKTTAKGYVKHPPATHTLV